MILESFSHHSTGFIDRGEKWWTLKHGFIIGKLIQSNINLIVRLGEITHFSFRTDHLVVFSQRKRNERMSIIFEIIAEHKPLAEIHVKVISRFWQGESKPRFGDIPTSE